MEVILECVVEFFFEILFDIAYNKKISKWIRYPIFLFFLLIYSSIVMLLFYIGIHSWKTNPFGGMVLVVIGILLAILFVWGFYKKSKEKESV